MRTYKVLALSWHFFCGLQPSVRLHYVRLHCCCASRRRGRLHCVFAAAAPLRTNSSILWKALYCIATLPKAMLSTYFSVLPRLSPMTWMARHLLRRRILASKLVVLNMQLRSLTARACCAFREGGRHKAIYSHAFIARVGAAAHTLAFPWGLQSWNILRRQLGIAFSLFFCLPTFSILRLEKLFLVLCLVINWTFFPLYEILGISLSLK